jgi:transcriptional regulator of nitric oxide reductase
MSDMRRPELYEAVRHREPVILTGLPRGKLAESQNAAGPSATFWRADHHKRGSKVRALSSS